MTVSEPDEPTEAIFCIGSNCGDREHNVLRGLEFLSGILTGYRHSAVYATPDCLGGQREYMNAVAIGYACLAPEELESLCKELEVACGRDSSARLAGDVPLDIDLVLFGRQILRQNDFKREFFQKGFRELITAI